MWTSRLPPDTLREAEVKASPWIREGEADGWFSDAQAVPLTGGVGASALPGLDLEDCLQEGSSAESDFADFRTDVLLAEMRAHGGVLRQR